MNKQASIAGKALADALLEKLANVGDHITDNGIDPTAVPNKSQRDQAAMVAEHDAIINPTPTKDGAGNGGGTVNQIFDAIVADAMGHGAAGYEQVHQTGITGAEGAITASGAPNQAAMQHMGSAVSEEVEKVAAVTALVDAGFDFNAAVNMVKQAEAEINFEQDQHTKQAAVASLMDRGVDFDSAVALVKQANATGGDIARGYMSPAWMQNHIASQYGQAGNEGVGANVGAHAKGTLRAGGRMLAEGAGSAVAGAGLGALAAKAVGKAAPVGAALGGLAGYYGGVIHGGHASLKNQANEAHAQYGREKQAAVAGLTRAGVDFDTAVGLVNAKAQELYGA